MTAPLTDAIVKAAAAGDREAIRTVYSTLAGPVLGYLRAKGVREPEELTSEVFLAVIPRISTVTGGATGLRRLVFAVAHARMVDHFRDRGRHGEPVEYQPARDARVVPAAEQTALDNMFSAPVVDVLADLPPDQREVIALRFVADLSLEQVAEVMERSVGAVKQLQRRGLLSVRQVLQQRGVTR